MYAQTGIKRNGEFFPEGTKLSPEDFGDDWDGLVEAGAIAPLPSSVSGNQSASEEVARRDQRIRELEAEVAELRERLGEEASSSQEGELSREELENLAEPLGIEFDAGTSNEELRRLVDEGLAN